MPRRERKERIEGAVYPHVGETVSIHMHREELPAYLPAQLIIDGKLYGAEVQFRKEPVPYISIYTMLHDGAESVHIHKALEGFDYDKEVMLQMRVKLRRPALENGG